MDIKEYMDQRVDDQINYFDRKSIENKKRYYNFSISKIIASAVVTVFSLACGEKTCFSYIIAILSSYITVSESIVNFCQYYEKWKIYRLTNEALKKEKYLYEMKSGYYYNLNEIVKENNFVNNIESLIENSNKEWNNLLNSKGKINDDNIK